MNQPYVYIYPFPLEPPSHVLIPPLWDIREHEAEFPVLKGSFLLALCFTHGSGYVNTTVNTTVQFIIPSFTLGVHNSLCLRLYSCPVNRFQYRFSRFCIYMVIYNIIYCIQQYIWYIVYVLKYICILVFLFLIQKIFTTIYPIPPAFQLFKPCL